MKSGGRQKGTPNKNSLPIEELAKALNIDPFEVLLRFAAGDWKGLGYDNEVYFSESPEGDGKQIKMGYVIKPEVRQKAASDACQYLYPKKKAIELSGKDGDDIGFRIIVEDYGSKK